MDRRNFIAAVAGNLIAVSFAAIAQRSEEAHRIGALSLLEGPFGPQERELWAPPLQTFGWVEGKNLLIERRYTNGRADLLKSMAEQLIRLNVELIVANGTVASLVAKSVATSIPIIAYRVADPVNTGLVASLSRPGGNVTAISLILPELDLKRLELLHELLPSAKAIGELWNPTNPSFRVGIGEKQKAYRSLGIQPIFVEVAAANELEGAVAKVGQRGGKALIVTPDPLFVNNFSAIVRAAQSFQLPIVIANKDQLLDGGVLLLYGPNDAEIERMLAVYVDKILKGARPADLPVLQPTKFDLVINLKTAKALGLTIPQSLLLRADEVIQ